MKNMNKKRIFFIACIFIVTPICLIIASTCIPNHSKTAQFSFETGCYAGYMDACNGKDIFTCLQRGLNICPKAAQAFQKWIDLGKSRNKP